MPYELTSSNLDLIIMHGGASYEGNCRCIPAISGYVPDTYPRGTIAKTQLQERDKLVRLDRSHN